MSTFTYKEPRGGVITKVLLDGKLVGAIYSNSGGFYYRPTHGEYGEYYPTLGLCKQSLEG